MAVSVTHTFVSAIADDGTAAAAGEVLPQAHWNAAHTVTGMRDLLTGNRNYYVRTDGNNSNDGTANNSSHAWLTVQHAMDIMASTLDFGGYTVTINIGAGSFAGVGLKATVGGGNIQFVGAGEASTTLTAGPNDGVFNFGQVIDCEIPLEPPCWFNAMTLDGTSAPNTHIPTISVTQAAQIILGLIGNFAGSSLTVVPNTGTNGFGFSVIGPSSQILNLTTTLTIACHATAGGMYSVTNGGQFFGEGATINITGNPAWGTVCAQAKRTGVIINQETVNDVGGSTTGKRYNVESNAVIDTIGGGPNNFPGNVAGTATTGGQYL